jgi:hypothetical protein
VSRHFSFPKMLAQKWISYWNDRVSWRKNVETKVPSVVEEFWAKNEETLVTRTGNP